MITIKDIEFEKSVEKGKLYFKADFGYKFDLYFQIFINIVLITSVFLNIPFYKNYGINEKSLFYAFLLFVLFINFKLYLKIKEKNLSQIRTNNPQETNRNLILKIAENESWDIIQNTPTKIVTFEDCGDIGIGNSKKHTRVFLLNNSNILFTIFTERSRINDPSIFERKNTKDLIIKKLTKL